MTCSYCLNSGHNKRTCPKRQKEIKNNPEGWEAHQYRSTQRKRKDTTCSYCAHSGHTRRTCEDFKADTKVLIKADMKWRKTVLGHMRDIGFAPGALLSVEGGQWIAGEYVRGNRLVLLKSLNWDRFHFGACLQSRLARDNQKFALGMYLDADKDDDFCGNCFVPIPYVEISTDSTRRPVAGLTKTKPEWVHEEDKGNARRNRWQVASPVAPEVFDSYLNACSEVISEESSKQVVKNYMNDDPFSSSASKKRPRNAYELDQAKNPWFDSKH